MRHAIHILYPVNRNTDVRVVECDARHESLDALLRPILDGSDYEHLTVLWRGRKSDMFVAADSSLRDLPRNNEATDIYRAATLQRHPKTPPELLPMVNGVAVIFESIVWG